MVQAHQLPAMEGIVTWTSDIKWIVIHATFTSLLVLAWAYIPA
jgi:hypothetical protein